MKKLTLFSAILLLTAAFFAGCDQQAALDQILEKPEMKSYLMTNMLEDENIKSEIVEYLLADTVWTGVIIERLTEQIDNRELMFENLLAYEGMSVIMLEKMAEDPELKNKMKEIGRRR